MKSNRVPNNQVLFSVLFAAALLLAACSPDAAGTETAPEDIAPEAEGAEGEEPAEGAPAGGTITIEATDPCSLFAQEEVSAAFGKEVVEVTPDQAGDRQRLRIRFWR